MSVSCLDIVLPVVCKLIAIKNPDNALIEQLRVTSGRQKRKTAWWSAVNSIAPWCSAVSIDCSGRRRSGAEHGPLKRWNEETEAISGQYKIEISGLYCTKVTGVRWPCCMGNFPERRGVLWEIGSPTGTF